MTTPYRADQVGSFLRPAELLTARQAAPPDPAQLRGIEDRHVLRVLTKQRDLGFEIFTDGELRRKNFMSDFTDAVDGFDHGDAVALNELGRRYGLGKDVPIDAEKSFHFYERAAAAGYIQAKANLAYMYFNGEGTTKDYERALQLNTEAAEAGIAQAQYALGYTYATGLGATVDAVLAEKYFLAAAEQGFVPAQQALITFYSNGKLVPENPALAALWLKRVVGRVSYLRRPWRKGDED
jgi:TPR repeat protein